MVILYACFIYGNCEIGYFRENYDKTSRTVWMKYIIISVNIGSTLTQFTKYIVYSALAIKLLHLDFVNERGEGRRLVLSRMFQQDVCIHYNTSRKNTSNTFRTEQSYKHA